jgi:hypothetical protein
MFEISINSQIFLNGTGTDIRLGTGIYEEQLSSRLSSGPKSTVEKK